MPRRIIRVGSGLLTAIFWLWTGANLMLDYLGRALSLKDLASKQGLLAQFLTWIFSTPWWVPSLLATAITIALLLLLYRDSRAGVSGELESSSYRIVEFFPDRSSLQQFSGGSLGARLGSVETACAIMVNALDYYSRDINTHCIKKLLLPNPAGDSLKSHVATTSHPGQADVIKETTQLAKKAGAAVRWYDHFVYHSIILADTDKSSGWVQVESVLPYSRTSKRPSYTIYRKSSEAAVLEMQRVFDEIWDHARPQ